MNRLIKHLLPLAGLAWLISLPVEAQTLNRGLANLLTEQRPSGSFAPDPAAAAATRDTIASLFLVELTSVPIASSSGGFVYQLKPDVGVYSRATNQFGPFFTERALRTGPGQASLGLTYQYSDFGSLQGGDLQAGTFPTNAARTVGALEPFSVDTLKLRLVTRTYNLFATYGVTDRLSLAGTIPLVSVSFSGERVRTVDNIRSTQSVQSGSSVGLGDMVLNGRYRLKGTGRSGISAGADLQFPSGSASDLRGTGKLAGRFVGIASREGERFALHVNGAVGVGGVSREVRWSAATGYALQPRVTLVGEIVGRWLSDLTRISDVYQPYPAASNVETMRWLPTDRGVRTTFLVMGAKWNVAGGWMLNTSLLMRLSDAGLRATVTPGISLDYTVVPRRSK